MSGKVLVSSLGLTLLGALTSGSVLNTNKWPSFFGHSSNLFVSPKKAEIEVKEKISEKIKEKSATISEVQEILQVPAPVSETVQVVEAPATFVVEETTPTQVPVSQKVKVPETILRGPEEKSPKPSSSSSGSGGWCVNPKRSYFVSDVKNCSNF